MLVQESMIVEVLCLRTYTPVRLCSLLQVGTCNREQGLSKTANVHLIGKSEVPRF